MKAHSSFTAMSNCPCSYRLEIGHRLEGANKDKHCAFTQLIDRKKILSMLFQAFLYLLGINSIMIFELS